MRDLIKTTFKVLVVVGLGVSILFQAGYAGSPPASANKANVVLKAMEDELARSMQVLGKKGNPPPYYIGYRITETYAVRMSASYGSLKSCREERSRLLDVEVRVGSRQLDNTHTIRGRYGYDFSFSLPVDISLEDDPDSIRSAIWKETDRKYKDAAEKLIKVKANKSVKAEEEDQSDDFTKETAQTYTEDPAAVSADIAAWKKKLKDYSAVFSQYPDVYGGEIRLNVDGENKYFTASEGTSLLLGRTWWRLIMYTWTKAEDGMRLYKTKIFDSRTSGNLPDDETVKAAAHQLAKDVLALRKAPLMEPFTGPAILSGQAAGVFFHEIFGHRIEGHRQKDERDGQTFAKMINQKILPEFMSVYDDPTLKKYGDTDLNGHYLYDDQGVKAQRVEVVQKGVLKKFLMCRSPIKGFSASNGHGRAQAGRRPVSRQGNLIIESSKAVPYETLRKMLLDECKKQGKTYGLLFDNISGGFTFTGRRLPQSFNVTPITVYRVYVDGRPDELVRGVDLIGTPLTSFSKVFAAGDKHDVFNGMCGAESGRVPVSAVCPPLLTAQIEVQKKYKASDKPPVLPPPERR